MKTLLEEKNALLEKYYDKKCTENKSVIAREIRAIDQEIVSMSELYTAAFKKNAKLIQIVNNNYDHVEELETLTDLYKDMKCDDSYKSDYHLSQEQAKTLMIICRTTMNSHYDYQVYTSIEFQNPINHVDIIMHKISTL